MMEEIEMGRTERLMELDRQGLLLELPCKIGDTVWRVCGTAYKWRVQPRTVEAMGIFPDRITIQHETECDVLGVRVFAAKEEAEAELAKREAADALHAGRKKDSIDELGLSLKTRNTLMRRGIDTISRLGEMSDDEILKLRGLGRKGLDEIIDRLEALDSGRKRENT